MKTIALVPIDNRPVCYQLPKQIVDLTGDYRLVLPDINLMGSLTKNADIKGIINWLDDISNVDIIVLSLDTIAYGGLIPSRRSNDSFSKIKTRINRLIEVLAKKNAKIYAFSSIMRISNNNINEEEKEYWSLYGKKIFQYSYNLHKMIKTHNLVSQFTAGSSPPFNCSPFQNATLKNPLSPLAYREFLFGQSKDKEAENNSSGIDIPVDILNDYLKTRKRNFEINKLYLELKRQGLFDTLIFSKDDCSEFGLNVKEAEELQELSKGIDGVFIKTGADEIPLTLISRAINKKKHIKIAPVYINPESTHKISKYEDISVKDSVESQIRLCGGIVSSRENCDLELIVNNFVHEQGELVMDVYEPLFQGNFNIPEKPYFIADIINANGSDNNFVSALFANGNFKEFYGYSAWNTTGNTLGSAISAALTYYGSKHPNKSAFLYLQLTRFLDDWAYQANVRAKIRNNTENLSNTVLKLQMKDFEKIVFNKFSVKNMKTKYKFPWKRFFEIEIELKKNYSKVPFVDILFYE